MNKYNHDLGAYKVGAFPDVNKLVIGFAIFFTIFFVCFFLILNVNNQPLNPTIEKQQSLFLLVFILYLLSLVFIASFWINTREISENEYKRLNTIKSDNPDMMETFGIAGQVSKNEYKEFLYKLKLSNAR